MNQQLYELPDGWEWKKLGEIFDIKSSKRVHKKDWCNDGIPFYRAREIVKLSKYGFVKNELYITEELFKQYAKSSGAPKAGDIMVSAVGTLGACYVVKDNETFYFKDASVLWFEKQKEIVSSFTKYAFLSTLLLNQIIRGSSGATVGTLTISKAKELNIPLPSLSEQKRIVEKLDALLSRVDQAVKHLQESLELGEALFASELNHVFSMIEYRQEIADLAEVKGGKRLPNGCQLQDDKTDYPYIRVSDFNDNGSIDVQNVKFINKDVQEQISRYTITTQDLYISIAGTIGKTGFVPPELDGANLTENAAKLVIKNRDTLFLNYLYYFTKTSDFASQAGLATKQVAQPKLALTRLSKIEIPICDISTQKKIVIKLDQVAKNKEELKNKLHGQIDDLNALKASLLDAAFRGEL